MNQKQDQDGVQNEVQMNNVNSDLQAKKEPLINKLDQYQEHLIEYIKKRRMIGQESINQFPISYIFCLFIGLTYTIVEEVNYLVVSSMIIALFGLLIHFIHKQLLLKIIIKLIFTLLLLLTFTCQLKSDYHSTTVDKKEINTLYTKIFLFGHLYIALNHQFQLWEIDIIISIMQILGITYMFGDSHFSFSFLFLLLFPLYLFLIKYQYGILIQKYFLQNQQSIHLQQIFHDLLPHNLFVTSLKNNNQVQLQFCNNKAKELLNGEVSMQSLFQKIKFSQFQKDGSDISLGTYSKKDNLWKLLETKHKKLEESKSDQKIGTAQQTQTNYQIDIASPTSTHFIQTQTNKNIPLSTKNSEKNKSAKFISSPYNSFTKRHFSSMSNKHIDITPKRNIDVTSNRSNMNIDPTSNKYIDPTSNQNIDPTSNRINNSILNKNAENTGNKKDIDFFSDKRKTTNIMSENGNQTKNTQNCNYLNSGYSQKIDKYEGMYFYSLEEPEKCQPVIVKIHYYCLLEEKSEKLRSNCLKKNSMNQTGEYLEQRFILVELKFPSEDKIQEFKNNKFSMVKAKEKIGLIKITKKFVQDIKQHFQQIITPYKQLLDQLTLQKSSNSQVQIQFQKQQQISSQYQQNFHQNDLLENNAFNYNMEYIHAQMNILIDHLRIYSNKSTKLYVEDIDMSKFFQDFFNIIKESTDKQIEFKLEMDETTFPQSYKSDPGRLKQILHFLSHKLISNHDCINPKFILKVSYVKKRTESLQYHGISFMDSKQNTSQISNEKYHRKSTHSCNKTSLKTVSNLHKIILKGHSNFETILKKHQIKDKDKLFRTIEKIGQYLGAPSIEFITEKDFLLRKYVFSLKEVTPTSSQKSDEKKQEFQQPKDVPEQLDQTENQKVNDNSLQVNNQNLDENISNNPNKTTIQNFPNRQNDLKIQNLIKEPNQINFDTKILIQEHKPNIIQNNIQDVNQFANTYIQQNNDHNFYDQSQQSCQAIIQDGDSQISVNQTLQFQCRFFK